uniref:Uncharacterized protein n=1 Tax=Oryza rufipogon TaxID=4529 RepID=A0A0E0Q9C2_ORYRU
MPSDLRDKGISR